MLRYLLGMCIALTSMQASAQMNTRVYGYLDGYWEKVDDTPQVGTADRESNPSEFNVPNLHMIVMSSKESYKSFLNISGSGAGVLDVRNAWVEKELAGEKLAFRIGKVYRKFGLYNEILDAVPTYIGIEPPEMFDGDHLLLTRTTNAMLHGRTEVKEGHFLNYSLTTGNDERAGEAAPLGVDVSYTIGANWKWGASYYTSGGAAIANTDGELGVGSGGVLSWMEKDTFTVSGVYLQYTDAKWIVQAESFSANHDAIRNSDLVDELCDTVEIRLNQRQKNRFNCAAAAGSRNLNGDYTVQTSYLRAGYIVPLEIGSITPYLQYDLYENEEVIWQKVYGGDNEAGLSDDGKFAKATVGAVYRPDFNVAIKGDYSQHLQKVNGKDANYGEMRFSFSYFWSI